jgi:Flp pilus assembly protein TadG
MPSTPFTLTPKRLLGRLRQERGQALVEFAVVLPVLMLIIIGILTFGRYMNYAEQETQLASEGARWAAVNFDPPGTESLQTYIESQATGELLNGSSDVTSPIAAYVYYPTGSSNTVGQPIRVCVTATVRLLPILGAATSVQIVQTATMRIEQPVTTYWSISTTVPSQCPTT